VLQSPAALGNVFDHLRPGAAVAAAGGKQPGCWMWPLRPWVADLHAPFIEDSPASTGPGGCWASRAVLRVYELAFGTGYVALGHARGR
jgi:hypothetical protein